MAVNGLILTYVSLRFLQSGVVVNRTPGGTFDVYVQELHRRLRSLPRSQLRVIHAEETDSDDDAEIEDHIDDSSDEPPPVTRRECVFWLLLACYQVMSENNRPGSSDQNATRYRHMKRLVLSHDQQLMSLARDAHVRLVSIALFVVHISIALVTARTRYGR